MARSIFLPLDLNTSKYWEVFFRIRGQYSPIRELELDLFTYPSSYINHYQQLHVYFKNPLIAQSFLYHTLFIICAHVYISWIV